MAARVLTGGSKAPRADELAAQHGVSLATAKRALALLAEREELDRDGRDVPLVAMPRLREGWRRNSVSECSCPRLLLVVVRHRGFGVARFPA